MDYLHNRGLDRLLDNINSYPEGISIMSEEIHDAAVKMTNAAVEAAKRVIKKANVSPIHEGMTTNATSPLFMEAMLIVTTYTHSGIPIKDSKQIVLLALEAVTEMIRIADLETITKK